MRYEICDLPNVADFSPILYLDTDVVVESDILRLFARILSTEKISVAMEFYPGFIESRCQVTPSVGSNFFAAERCLPAEIYGFNSGVIGAKSSSQIRSPFAAVAKAMRQITSAGIELDSMDQGIANYIFIQSRSVDLVGIAPFVAAGESFKLHRYPTKPVNACNVLVHFFATIDRPYYMRMLIEERLVQRRNYSQGRFFYTDL